MSANKIKKMVRVVAPKIETGFLTHKNTKNIFLRFFSTLILRDKLKCSVIPGTTLFISPLNNSPNIHLRPLAPAYSDSLEYGEDKTVGGNGLRGVVL